MQRVGSVTGGYEGMFWRFHVARDPDVDRCAVLAGSVPPSLRLISRVVRAPITGI